ncbi:hypothetical protein PVK06_005998 [Gossypium arboreum]|uniref:Uncharacterized protein n=1 Tax=Gossypium arboreum TaxID=29729 RepID=A0ABR0QW34_GOSAR|nr:hypothetical protein PVK06_005998 [Gossypium arboreum]
MEPNKEEEEEGAGEAEKGKGENTAEDEDNVSFWTPNSEILYSSPFRFSRLLSSPKLINLYFFQFQDKKRLTFDTLHACHMLVIPFDWFTTGSDVRDYAAELAFRELEMVTTSVLTKQNTI